MTEAYIRLLAWMRNTHLSETILPFLRAQYAQRKFDALFSVIDVRAVDMCIDSKNIFSIIILEEMNIHVGLEITKHVINKTYACIYSTGHA